MAGEQEFPASSRSSGAEEAGSGESSGAEAQPGGDFSSDSVTSESGGGGAPAMVPADSEGTGRAATRSGGGGLFRRRRRETAPNMLPGRERRGSGVERILVRLIATCGIVGIGVAIAAIMVSSHSKGWVVGLVVSAVTVVLSAVLWSSRQL